MKAEHPDFLQFPLIITQCDDFEKLLESPQLSEGCKPFKEDWLGAAHRLPSGSGRAARIVRSDTDTTSLAKMVECVRMPSVKTKACLIGDEVSNLDKLWHFAHSPTMQNVGPEFNFLPALKWTSEGTRKVYMVPVNELRAFLRAKIQSTTPMSIPRLSNFLTESDAEVWKELVEKVSTYYAVVAPKTFLYTPAGYLK